MGADIANAILETDRLEVRRVAPSDDTFLHELVNDPSWLTHIGDRGVRSPADAREHIEKRIWSQYRAFGYGMYVAALRSTARPIGLCGLVKREFLDAPDLGFALLPYYTGQGYAFEAARALMLHASAHWGIARLYAIVKRDNPRSIRLLERLGFQCTGPLVLAHGDEVELYATP